MMDATARDNGLEITTWWERPGQWAGNHHMVGAPGQWAGNHYMVGAPGQWAGNHYMVGNARNFGEEKV